MIEIDQPLEQMNSYDMNGLSQRMVSYNQMKLCFAAGLDFRPESVYKEKAIYCTPQQYMIWFRKQQDVGDLKGQLCWSDQNKQ